jgi:hypothetical protein
MSRIISITLGLALTLLGAFLLIYNVLENVLHAPVPGLWRLWPIWLVVAALAFLLPPLLAPQHRGLGAFFILGFPILGVSGVAFSAVFSRSGGAWGTLWPLMILATAMGLGMAAVYMRVIWLLIPAFIVGTIGVILQFCVLTGWWSAWSVLWTGAPMAIGLALLLIGAVRRYSGVFLGGLFVSGASAAAAMGMIIILTGRWSLLSLAGGLGLIGLGGALIVWNVLRAQQTQPARPVSAP